LVASHIRIQLQTAMAAGIPHNELQDYVKSEASVKSFRERQAIQCKVQPVDIKRLMNMLAYGNSGRDWEDEHSTSMPPDAVAIKTTLNAVVKHLWEKAPKKVKDFCNSRERPL
jgi:hypothetical protein